MLRNVTEIHVVQNEEEVLSCEAFRIELGAIRERREREEEQARLKAEAERLRRDNQLLADREAANDWNRLILQMTRTIIADGLEFCESYNRCYFFKRPNQLIMDGKDSVLERSLKALDLEKKWLLKTGAYVDGTRTLRQYAEAAYSISRNFSTFSYEIRGWGYSGKRYYDCDDTVMEAVEDKKATLMHIFSKLIAEVLEQKGYQVYNTIRLCKVRGSKAAYEWVGDLTVTVE